MLSCFYRGLDGDDDDEPRPIREAELVRAVRPLHREAPLPQFGLRRDRTLLFRGLRAATSTPTRGGCTPKRGAGAWASAADELSKSMSQIYEEAAQAQASLASKLAQHRGTLQFGTDFRDRAPPLELRMLLPHLETAIELLLGRLGALCEALRALEVGEAPAGRQAAEVRDSLETQLCEGRAEARRCFEGQRADLRRLTAQSPLFSPALSPAMSEKLVAAFGSVGSRSPLSTCASPLLGASWSSPPSCEPIFRYLDAAIEEDDGEDDCVSEPGATKAGEAAFSSLFSSSITAQDGRGEGEGSPQAFSSLFSLELREEEEDQTEDILRRSQPFPSLFAGAGLEVPTVPSSPGR